MGINMKEIIILGNEEEEAEVLAICKAWEPFFQKNGWYVKHIFIGLNAEQTLMEIADSKADMVICFQLAGFHIKMSGADIFLNKLYCPIVNIIWKPLEEEELEQLNSRLNVTIVFFTNLQRNVEQVKQRTEFPPYIQYIPDLDLFWETIDLEKALLYGNDDIPVNDRISVIVPCYNVEKYIDRCMKSLINQTIGMDHLEIILINDASTDHTYQELLKWERQYSEQILVINFEKNSRQGTARNVGMQYAAGEYISFLDADDWIEPTMYEVLLSAMKSGDFDMAQGGVAFADEETYFAPEKRRISGDFVINITSAEDRKKVILGDGILSCYAWNKLYKKSFLTDNHIVFLENMVYEDIFFLGLLNMYVERVICVGEYVYHYFNNNEGVTKQRNTANIFDFFDVGSRCLLEYKERNLFAEYSAELEYCYLQHCIEGIVRLIKITEKVDYNTFLQIQKRIMEHIPEYRKNPYINPGEVEGSLLDLLDKEVSEEVWEKAETMLRLACGQ